MMPDRSVAPPFVAPATFNLPSPGIIDFENGSRMYLLHVGDQPVVTIEFIFRAGSWFERSAGQAFFTAKMLAEGTRSYTAAGIAEKLEFYGAFTEMNSGFDYINFTIHLPARHFEKIQDVIAELLFEPAFPEKELELLRQIQLNQLQVNLQKNSYVASRQWRNTLFKDHPYGHLLSGEAINTIDSNALREYFGQYLSGRCDVFLTGNFGDKVPLLISAMIKDRQKSRNPFGIKPSAQPEFFGHYLEKADSLQTAIYMGKKCIDRNHPEYPATLLLNEVFGGYFGSRLMQNIREEKGYTYGIHSNLVHLKNDSYYMISAEVKKGTLEGTLHETQLEIDRLKHEPVPAAELDQARNHLKGSFLNSITSPMAVAAKLKNIYFYDLPLDYYDKLFEGLDSATSEQLTDNANNILFDSPLSWIAAG